MAVPAGCAVVPGACSSSSGVAAACSSSRASASQLFQAKCVRVKSVGSGEACVCEARDISESGSELNFVASAPSGIVELTYNTDSCTFGTCGRMLQCVKAFAVAIDSQVLLNLVSFASQQEVSSLDCFW